MDQDKFEKQEDEISPPLFQEDGELPVYTEATDTELEATADEEQMLAAPEEAPEDPTSHEEEVIDEKTATKRTEPRIRKIDGRYDFIELFVFTLVAVLIITSFFFRHSVVDGDSMESTLSDGEHLILSSFLYTPKANDIIVCEDYSTGLKKPIVKRVIATEGQRVDILSATEVYVDGEPLDESAYVYIDGIDFYYEYPMSFTVSEGHLFVLGDHRNASSDSRAFGEISEKSVLGKVVLRIYPFDKFGTVD